MTIKYILYVYRLSDKEQVLDSKRCVLMNALYFCIKFLMVNISSQEWSFHLD